MTENNRKTYKYLLWAIPLGLFAILITILVVNNIRMRTDLKGLESPILQTHDGANESRRQTSSEFLVSNEEQGIWDKQRKPKLELIHELTIGKQDIPETVFYKVFPVKADVNGNIYVAESRAQQTSTIKKFDSKGNYLMTIGRRGQGPGEFLRGFNFEFEQDTILTVFDPGTARITRFSCNGHYLNSVQIEIQGFEPPALIYGSAIDDHGFYYLSFYDYHLDKLIHKFDSQGKYVSSFGIPFELREEFPSAFIGINFKENYAAGRLARLDNDLFFSQNNPYEIRRFSLNGNLRMKILRKNSFMPPAKVEIEGGNTYAFIMPAHATAIGVWQDILINCVSVPSHINESIGTVIDFFNLDGHLLTTIAVKENISFTYIDLQGRLYGIENHDVFGERIVRYVIKLS